MYVLCSSKGSDVRYSPLYIHSFSLSAPRRLPQGRYEEIENVSDKLRWLRAHRDVPKETVADQVGLTLRAYRDLEAGTTQHIQPETLKGLADYYGVPITDLLDEYHQFLYDGQAYRIRTYRESLGMQKKCFARTYGIPIRSLQVWENGKKVISRQCWERYFKGRA